MLAPTLVLLGGFGVLPLVYAIRMSLYDLRGGAGPFIGLGNYFHALTSAGFRESLAITLYYALGTIPVAMVLSFLFAYGLFRVMWLRGLLRTLYFLPYVTSIVAAAMVWRVILKPDETGLANAMLEYFGFSTSAWLLDSRSVLSLATNGLVPPTIGPSVALCCVMLFEIWHSSGFMTVVFLAGLSAIPKEYDEAAMVDGAGVVRRMRHITLPLLSPTVFFLAIVGVIRSFQAFESFYALTGDGRGPLDTTQNLTVYIYSNFYEFGRWGYGTAVATLLSAMIVVMTIVQWRVGSRRVHYE